MGYQAYDAGSESQNGGGRWGSSLDNHSAARAILSVVCSLTAYGADSVRMVSGSLHRLGIGGLCHARAQCTTESTMFVLRQRTQVRRYSGGVFLIRFTVQQMQRMFSFQNKPCSAWRRQTL